MKPIFPGQTIGILGSGQLGRMLAIAARRMGYCVVVYAPDAEDSPAGQVADTCLSAAYDDLGCLAKFADCVDVITYEFENIPPETAMFLAEKKPLHPGPHVLAVSRNRLKEKTFVKGLGGVQPTPFAPVSSLQDLHNAVAALGTPAVLKTCELGYDGKGQWKIDTNTVLEDVFDQLGGQEAILEAFISLEKEISVVAVRGQDGDFAHYGATENEHQNHILHLSTSPANVDQNLEKKAVETTKSLMEKLDVVGVLCVEFFITTAGDLLFNEMAPRPHNSGHLTIEGFQTSQFEQQLRAVCGLPLGSTERLAQTVAMTNLLGDLWAKNTPNWADLLQNHPDVCLHLYGKSAARPGRKMGHLTACSKSDDAAQKVTVAFQMLTGY